MSDDHRDEPPAENPPEVGGERGGGRGNYTEERKQLFAGLSLADLVAEMRKIKERPRPPKSPPASEEVPYDPVYIVHHHRNLAADR